jgi:hypothetical protein
MQILKLSDISGKKKEYLKAKFYELETDSEMKNIRNLYSDISGSDLVQTATGFWLGAGNSSLPNSYFVSKDLGYEITEKE